VTAKNKDDIPLYVAEAIALLDEIMSNAHNHIYEQMTKATRGESFVLKFLSESDSAVFPSELSVALHSSTARISAILRALEKKGEIVRETDKTNRRNVLVTITEAGRNRTKCDMKEAYGILAKVFIDMGEADTQEFIRLTQTVSDAVQKSD
jgi:DNA-binding MarR family transcriptional regulator